MNASPTPAPVAAEPVAASPPLPAPPPTAAPSGVAAGTVDADPPTWVESACLASSKYAKYVSVVVKPSQCEDLSVNIAANLAWEIPGLVIGFLWAVWRVWSWLRHRRARRTGTAPAADWQPPTPPLSAETLARLHDLLLGLPRWQEDRARQNFVTMALSKADPLLHRIIWTGSARDVARSLVEVCTEFPGTDGTPPLCRLLAGIPREFGAKPDRDREIAALLALLGCP